MRFLKSSETRPFYLLISNRQIIKQIMLSKSKQDVYHRVKPREDKGDREGIPHTHPVPWVIRLELFLESDQVNSRAAWMFRGGFA